MEAATLQKKKNTISKGKLKKSLKNLICRPDQVFWPEITEVEGKRLESVLKNHKVHIPEFKKPHWNEVKDVPKEQRPKPPKLKKVEGLLLGIRECSDSIQNGECSAVIIESKISPRLIIHPMVQMCTDKNVPFLCLSDLRKVTTVNFGIPTSCVGIKCDCLLDVMDEVVSIARNYPNPNLNNKTKQITNNDTKVEKMDIESSKEVPVEPTSVPTFTFLYRTNKKSRVFVPTAQDCELKVTKQFIGQDFIKFSEKPALKDNPYMKMMLKRISNNPDRVKKK